MAEQDQQIADAVRRDAARLRNFIRRSVADPADAEDILQDVFHELVQAYRMMDPIDHVTAWLFKVARNRITDLFRRRAREARRSGPAAGADDAASPLDLLPSSEAGPEAAYARSVLLQELADAIADLPAEQRDVFVAHELMGRSFKDLVAETGVALNTLLSRKYYAVRHLRRRLRDVYDDYTSTGE